MAEPLGLAVLKYELAFGDNLVKMPKDAIIIHAGQEPSVRKQKPGMLCFWAETELMTAYSGMDVKPEDVRITIRHFRVIYTGETLSGNRARWKHIASCQTGAMMAHIYEGPKL